MTLKETTVATTIETLQKYLPEIDARMIDKIDIQSLIAIIKKYINMPRPIEGTPQSYPFYTVVDGKISRGGDPSIDVRLCYTADCLRGQTHGYDGAKICRLAFNAIEHYAYLPLTGFVFMIPATVEASAQADAGKAVLLVKEDIGIMVLKGVENMLWEIYNELPEGGLITDNLVKKKIVSMVKSALPPNAGKSSEVAPPIISSPHPQPAPGRETGALKQNSNKWWQFWKSR